MDELALPVDSPARTQQILAAAARHSDELSSGVRAVLHGFVRNVVQRVVVHADRIEVEAGRQQLRSVLTGNRDLPSGVTTQQEKRSTVNLIRLRIEARVKRCGIETRLVLAPDDPGHSLSNPSSSLIKALARAHRWHEWILAGKVSGQRAIAQKLGLNERYVSRVLECAFLAPDIVEAILSGRQPSDLTFEKLTRPLPLNWIDQRKQLGFPSPHPQTYP